MFSPLIGVRAARWHSSLPLVKVLLGLVLKIFVISYQFSHLMPEGPDRPSGELQQYTDRQNHVLQQSKDESAGFHFGHRKLLMSTYDEIRQARKTSSQVLAEQQASDTYGIDLTAMKQSPLMRGYKPIVTDDPLVERINMAQHVMSQSGYLTLKPLLPLLLSIRGKPYHLHDHFPFAPFFRTRMPRTTLLKTGRQVSKSTSLAAQGVLFSNCIPYFSTLFITPLFEQVRRFSQNYVAPFIETSPVGRLFSGESTINNVLQRSFKNRSQMVFSFAYLDAERTRGISADKNVIDEIQDMDITFLPVIHETISASRDWGLVQYAGTPKTLDNTIERLWTDSSMAEWVIKCPHGGCGHWNIPALEFDLLQMIGPAHNDVSENCPGVICAKCMKPINPRPAYQGGTGRWVHRVPERRWSFAGYHVPQVIMPMHYASAEKWQKLVDKMKGKGNVPLHIFYNEVCGESWDSGSKLVTVTDLKKAASLPWACKAEEAKQHIGQYLYRFVAVDWGGGGVSKGKSDLSRQSYTTIAVVGLTPDGRVDVIYGFRSLNPHDHVREAKLILGIMNTFQCSHVVHDYTGAGTVRETILAQAGLALNNILPVAYTGPAKGGLILFKPATDDHPRNHYTMDRNRALSYTCQFIKSNVIRFFQYDYRGSEDVGLLHDFLNLIEDKSASGSGRDSYKILRDPSGPDDFAQAVTMGTMMLFQMQGQWPDLAAYEDVEVGEDVLLSTRGMMPLDWS